MKCIKKDNGYIQEKYIGKKLLLIYTSSDNKSVVELIYVLSRCNYKTIKIIKDEVFKHDFTDESFNFGNREKVYELLDDELRMLLI